MTATSTTTRDEAALLARIAAGSESALGELYDRYGGVAYGLALRILGDRTLAEDAVQDAFIAIWRSARRFDADRGSARTWIFSLVHRRAVDLVRSELRRRRLPLALPERGELDSAEAAAALRADRRRARDGLDALPHPLRQLLELAYYGGLTQSEIAARLELPIGTVKSRTAAALARLRELLAEEPHAAAICA